MKRKPGPQKAGPLSEAEEARLQRLEAFANLLDARYLIPGTRWRYGWDGIFGLVPVIGDAAMAAVALWALSEARSMGASRGTMARMVGNIGVDFAFGSVPVFGTIFDVAFKSNRRNVALLRRHLVQTRSAAKHRPSPGPGQQH